MNIELNTFTTKLQPVLNSLKRYVTLLFIMMMLIIFGFIVYRINHFSNLEPSDDAVTEKLQSVQRPRLDQTVIDKIQQLQDQNIEAKSLFDQARNNPFSE